MYYPEDADVTFSDVFEFLLKSKQGKPKTNHTQAYSTTQTLIDIISYPVPFGNVLDHYADVWDNYRNDPDVLIIFYEDLKEVQHS